MCNIIHLMSDPEGKVSFSSESADVSRDEVPKLPYYSVSAFY